VERFRWQIYTPNFGTDFDNLLGRDAGYVASELQRRLTDAFLPDNRILGIADFSYTANDDTLTASVTANTVFGDVTTTLEVQLA